MGQTGIRGIRGISGVRRMAGRIIIMLADLEMAITMLVSSLAWLGWARRGWIWKGSGLGLEVV